MDNKRVKKVLRWRESPFAGTLNGVWRVDWFYLFFRFVDSWRAVMAQLQKQIRASIRKRAKKPPKPRAEPLEKLTVSIRQQQDFSDSHPNVLLNIESTLVQIRSQVDGIDDYVVEQALRASIRRRSAQNAYAQMVVDILDQMQREMEEDPEIWRKGLRVVYTSVKTHSDCRPGDQDYLDFVAPFVAEATGE